MSLRGGRVDIGQLLHIPGWVLFAAIALGWVRGALGSDVSRCSRVTLEGEVAAGREWSAEIGGGWKFRVMPVAPSGGGYSGWDLVMDRDQPAGYPDALLLATLPYNSLNEREIATTFGLRAQDAIGWNPRSFRFLADPAAFSEGQQVFRSLVRSGAMGPDARRSAEGEQGMNRLLQLEQRAASGEFRILDAHLVPGSGDPAGYAQKWALAAARTPHQNDAAPSGQASARGSLDWMRFSITLWLPGKWTVPHGTKAVGAACP